MIRRVLTLVIFASALAALYFFARDRLTLELLIEREAELRDWIDRQPWRALGIGFAIYVGVSMVPGTTGKALVAAWLFGFWKGLLIVNVGLTVAAILSFLVSRYVFRDAVRRLAGERLQRLNATIERKGAGYLFVARVLHAPFSVTSYLMGATPIRLVGFWWATQLGLLPGNVVFVYAGWQAPTLQQISEEGVLSLLSPGLIAAFVALSVAPLIIRLIVRRVLRSRGVDEDLG